MKSVAVNAIVSEWHSPLLGMKMRSHAHQLSQKCRRRIKGFRLAKTRKTRYPDIARTRAAAQYVVAAYNLVPVGTTVVRKTSAGAGVMPPGSRCRWTPAISR